MIDARQLLIRGLATEIYESIVRMAKKSSLPAGSLDGFRGFRGDVPTKTRVEWTRSDLLTDDSTRDLVLRARQAGEFIANEAVSRRPEGVKCMLVFDIDTDQLLADMLTLDIYWSLEACTP